MPKITVTIDTDTQVFNIGDHVEVSPNCIYYNDWKAKTLEIVGINRARAYFDSEPEIKYTIKVVDEPWQYGYTDGWSANDLTLIKAAPDYPADTHICDASGYECKQNAEIFTRSENVQNKSDNLDKSKCRRCDGTGVLFGGVDGNIDFKCDPCPAPPLKYSKKGYLILPEISVRQKPINHTQDGLCPADETLPPINEATGHEWSDT